MSVEFDDYQRMYESMDKYRDEIENPASRQRLDREMLEWKRPNLEAVLPAGTALPADRAAITIVTERVSPELIAAEIVDLVRPPEMSPRLTLMTEAGHSDIYIESGGVSLLGQIVRRRWTQAARI